MLGADTSGSPPGRCPPLRQNQRRIVAAVLRMRCPQAPYTRAPRPAPPRLALHEPGRMVSAGPWSTRNRTVVSVDLRSPMPPGSTGSRPRHFIRVPSLAPSVGGISLRGGLVVARACRLASPGLVVLLLVLAPTPGFAATSVPACGHANVDNPGHHYGLIKNGCLSGTPRPPAPTPAPTLAPKPDAGVVGNAIQNLSSAKASGSDPTDLIPPAPAPPPITVVNPLAASDPKPVTAPSGDRNLWVVMALLPIILVILLLFAARTATRHYGSRRAAAATATAE